MPAWSELRPGTHITVIGGSMASASSAPSNPTIGDQYWDTTQHTWFIWSGNNWLGTVFSNTSTSTTTSTSTSTTTSTTTTSTSSSTTTSTSTSTTTTG